MKKFPLRPLALLIGAGVLAITLPGCSDDDDDDTPRPDPVVDQSGFNFNRIATLPVCQQLEPNCNTDTETAAEILAASEDGMTVIYTDSPGGQVGFIDITDPAQPEPLGVLAMSGEPTSVAVKGDYALVAVNTSADFVNVSGELIVVDIAQRQIVRSIPLGGQPDSIAVSTDGRYAVIAIENQRDEDLNDGALPQLPAGLVVNVDISGDVADWAPASIPLTGLATLYGDDPEPEYIDINSDNIAAVTLQENNHIVLINLADNSIVNHFSAGNVDLNQVDVVEEDALIDQSASLTGVLREPDGLTWINADVLATANEGDLDGGSRDFSFFDKNGQQLYTAGNSLEHAAARIGHYPDARSENKGNEPENITFASYGSESLLFVNSERSSLIFVYDVADIANPVFRQALPAASAPEGVIALPERNLLLAASEADSRGDVLRSSVNVYQFSEQPASYPTISSVNRADGTPIPWAALSGLAADPADASIIYSVEDSYFLSNRIFTIDIRDSTAELIEELRIRDDNDVLAAQPAAILADASVDEDDPSRIDIFDEADRAALINADKTVNIDPEGIARAAGGGFWIASEGSGTVGDSERPVNSINTILKVNDAGVIESVIALPDDVNDQQLRFGFEGIAEEGSKLYVAFQRAWGGEAGPRIGVYDTVAMTWSFLFYPLDAVESQNGGWVGLSDLTSLGNGQFLALERDNQGGPDAAIKRLYQFDVTGLAEGATVTKSLVRDILPDLKAPGGLVIEKIEGSTVLPNGDVYIVSDNDGVDDNSGETQLINLGNILGR